MIVRAVSSDCPHLKAHEVDHVIDETAPLDRSKNLPSSMPTTSSVSMSRRLRRDVEAGLVRVVDAHFQKVSLRMLLPS